MGHLPPKEHAMDPLQDTTVDTLRSIERHLALISTAQVARMVYDDPTLREHMASRALLQQTDQEALAELLAAHENYAGARADLEQQLGPEESTRRRIRIELANEQRRHTLEHIERFDKAHPLVKRIYVASQARD